MNRRGAIILGLCVVVWIAAIFLQSNPDVPTVYSTKPTGVRALFLTLERLDWEPRAWLYPYAKLHHEEDDNVLFVTEPTTFGAEEQLLKWVELGNTLVVFDRGDSPLKALREKLKIERDGPLIDTARFAKKLPGASKTVSLNCPKGYTECASVARVTAPGGTLALKDSGFVSVAKVDGEHVIAVLERGKGRIWYFAGTEPIQNSFIDREDNFRLLYQIATSRSYALFDEFHHGFLSPADPAQRAPIQGMVTLAVYLAIALFASVLSRSIRFGPPRPRPALESTASVDFATALGLLYADHETAEVLPAYLRAWRVRVEKAFGVSRLVAGEELVTELVEANVVQHRDRDRMRRTVEQIAAGKSAPLEESISLLESVFSPLGGASARGGRPAGS